MGQSINHHFSWTHEHILLNSERLPKISAKFATFGLHSKRPVKCLHYAANLKWTCAYATAVVHVNRRGKLRPSKFFFEWLDCHWGVHITRYGCIICVTVTQFCRSHDYAIDKRFWCILSLWSGLFIYFTNIDEMNFTLKNSKWLIHHQHDSNLFFANKIQAGFLFRTF